MVDDDDLVERERLMGGPTVRRVPSRLLKFVVLWTGAGRWRNYVILSLSQAQAIT